MWGNMKPAVTKLQKIVSYKQIQTISEVEKQAQVKI
jgi:hypothetical protein